LCEKNATNYNFTTPVRVKKKELAFLAASKEEDDETRRKRVLTCCFPKKINVRSQKK
jgi:hypothetical protein